MAINIADNMGYNGKKPLDGRTEYATLSAMKAVADANINEGCLAYNKEDGKYYKFLSTNTVDATTGKWREFETGGGGQTYNDFTGATASTAGAHGLVPAPSAGDEDKVLRGDGTWATLVTGYDWSNQSNEGNILLLTERPIGQHYDGKILYQKIVNIGALPSSPQTKIVAHGISNIENIVKVVGIANNNGNFTPMVWASTASFADVIATNCNDTNIQVSVGKDRSAVTSSFVILQYTKTTDSALPAGVKFAGVTDTGDIIYKKWVTTGGAVPSGGTLLYRQALLNGKDIIYYTT